LAFLTTKHAAKALTEGLGLSVSRQRVRDAIEEGRLRSERGTGRRSPFLIPEEEVERILQEHRRRQALNAERGCPSGPEERSAEAWDMLPRNSMEYLWRVDWSSWRRPSGREAGSSSLADSDEDGLARLRKDLEGAEQQGLQRRSASETRPKRSVLDGLRKRLRSRKDTHTP